MSMIRAMIRIEDNICITLNLFVDTFRLLNKYAEYMKYEFIIKAEKLDVSERSI